MTKPYGLSMQGCRTQLLLDGHVDEMIHPFKAADYMKIVLMESIGKIVIRAKELMEWYQ